MELVSDHFSKRTLRAADAYPSVLCSLPSALLGANPFLCHAALPGPNLPVWLAANCVSERVIARGSGVAGAALGAYVLLYFPATP